MNESLESKDNIIDNVENKETENTEPKISIEKSILLSIKKLLGILPEDENFDTDIIIHINTVFTTLLQLGVGPKNGYRIIDANNEWSEFVQDEENLDSVKTYIYLKVRLVFDPPANSFVVESFKQTIQELEWRLNVASDSNE